MPQSQEERALALIDRVYEAAVEPARWNAFIAEFSRALGGPAVLLSLQLPGTVRPMQNFRYGVQPDTGPVLVRHVLKGLPWGSLLRTAFLGGFGRGSDYFPDEDVPDTDFYREWMQPQGLAPEGPIAHTIAVEHGVPVAGIALFRKVGGRPFGPDEVALGQLLVPHLARAFALYRKFGAVQQRRDALAAVIDRLPTGVFLVSEELRPVVSNRAADRIAEAADGLRVDEAGLRADDLGEQSALNRLVATAAETGDDFGGESAITLTRPSGRRPLGVLVIPLGPPQNDGDPVAALFVGDPESARISTVDVLQRLYSLTQAEAELVQLISEGHSLEEAAEQRGVTRNTARTQLKQVFAKTGAKRQGDLVRLVLTSVARFVDE